MKLKLSMMRGCDYISWEDADKDGAIYSAIFDSAAEVSAAIKGAELADICIGTDVIFQFKIEVIP